MGPTECPAPRQGWKQVVQESSRIDSSWLMSLNTFTYLSVHSLWALFYLDKKEGLGGGSGINGGEELEGGGSGMGNNWLSW